MGSAFRLVVCGVLAAGILLTIGSPMDALGQAGGDKTSPDTQHYQILQSARSGTARPVSLELFSATVSGQSLELHLGFRNTSSLRIDPFGLLTPDDFRLTEEKSSRRIETADIDPAITVISPLDGLGAELTNRGGVRFSNPKGRGPFKLRISGFEPIRFSLDPDRSIDPPTGLERLDISPDLVLNSVDQTLAIFSLHISRIEFRKEGIRFHIAFKNTSNRRFQFHPGAFSGKDASLVDGNRVLHRPTAISTEFENSIGPVEHSWSPSESIAGTLTFPRPHPHALLELSFSMKGFNDLLIVYDSAGRTYTSKVSSPELQDRHSRNPLVRAGTLHEELSASLLTHADALNRRDESGYLAGFADSSLAKPEQQPFLAAIAKVPIQKVRFGLAPGQELARGANGKRLGKVLAFMDYSIEGAAEDEHFRSDLRCSFVREEASSRWLIDEWEFTKNPPFWLLGLTERHLTEHFLIFYCEGASAERILSISCRQLERAYTKLQQYSELELGDRYLAFLLDEGDDFATITGMAGDHLQGAASSSYELEGSNFTVFNRAMFINDESIGKQTWWGEARQRTITHELVHLILSGDTRPYTPPWLVEGAAVHITGQIDTRTRWGLLRSGHLKSLSLSNLSRGQFPGHESGASELGLEYHYSGEAVRYLVKRYGLAKFLTYYRSFAKLSPAEIDAIWRKQLAASGQGKVAPGAVMHEITNKLSIEHLEGDLDEIDARVKAAILKK